MPPLRLLPLFFLALGVLAPARQSGNTAVRTVDAVDLDRYLGDWYEIARFPNSFQRDCAGDVRASYARRPDGRIDVVNRCREAGGEIAEARGVARIVDRQTNAKLEVRFAPAFLSFLPFVWGDYWIIGLADDYSWAVVGSPDRKYLWILAREPALEGDSLDRALSIAWANGFDTGRLVQTAQARGAANIRRPPPERSVVVNETMSGELKGAAARDR